MVKGANTLIPFPWILTALLTFLSTATAQQPGREQIIALLERDGCVTLEQSKIRICKYAYVFNGQTTIEAVTIRPLDEKKYPGLILLPGYILRSTRFRLSCSNSTRVRQIRRKT
jgi:hypothetical protein